MGRLVAIRHHCRCHAQQVNVEPSSIPAMTSTSELAGWQKSVPYQLASKDEEFHAKHIASCMCGAVQYAVDCDPVAAKYCHCTSCQRLHGESTALVQIARLC